VSIVDRRVLPIADLPKSGWRRDLADLAYRTTVYRSGREIGFFQCFYSTEEDAGLSDPSLTRIARALEGCARLFRPRYAKANLGHAFRKVGLACWINSSRGSANSFLLFCDAVSFSNGA
jgi:hypothetical protein